MPWKVHSKERRRHIQVHKNMKWIVEFEGSERRDRQGSDGHLDTMLHPTGKVGSLKGFKQGKDIIRIVF